MLSANSSGLEFALALAGLALVSGILCRFVLSSLLRRFSLSKLMDQPGHRSLHDTPIPRIGGFILLLSAGAGLYFGSKYWPQGGSQLVSALTGWPTMLLTTVSGLILLGLLDDTRGLPVLLRLLVHLLLAAGFVASLAPQPEGIGLPFTATAFATVFALIWLTNLYNFMDGSDGLAGIVTAIGFASYAVLAPGSSLIAVASACISGAAIGFLLLNWHPARVFMGDAGSIPLGFLAGAFGLAGSLEGYWPSFMPLLLFFPFIFDATITLLIRAVRREAFWRPHRNHAYQRLILSGFSHRSVAILYASLMLICALVAFSQTTLNRQVPIAFWAVIICLHASVYWWAWRAKPTT